VCVCVCVCECERACAWKATAVLARVAAGALHARLCACVYVSVSLLAWVHLGACMRCTEVTDVSRS